MRLPARNWADQPLLCQSVTRIGDSPDGEQRLIVLDMLGRLWIVTETWDGWEWSRMVTA